MDLFFLVEGIGGGLGIYASAVALGARHGIDWDHIAAITDITSSTAPVDQTDESWLIAEPGIGLTDESHHYYHGEHDHPHTVASAGSGAAGTAVGVVAAPTPLSTRLREHRAAIWLGTLYALGHGTVVTLLGILAIIAGEFLPDWVDGIMERVVGLTLIFLSAYLFYAIYRYFRSGQQFHMRSRWMFVFAGVSAAWHWARSRLGEHEHIAPATSYGPRTAYGVGVIHGIGAETGTQALVIAAAVGATSQAVAVAVLVCFVVGLLISNSFVTLATTVGFVSARRRQAIYLVAGLVTAVLSLIVGLLFLNAWTGILPDLDQYVRWIGGPA